MATAVVITIPMLALQGCGPSDPIQTARQQMMTGDLEGSLETLREVVNEDSNDPQVLFLYAQALNRSGQPGLAEWPLRKAMEDPIWFEKAATLLASVEQSGGNFENAAKVYAEILAVNPEDLATRIRRANACARSPALFEEALAEVDRILEIAPNELGAFKPRILAYLGMNKPEEAGEAIEELGERIAEQKDDGNPIRGWHCATMAIFASDSGDIELARERWAECEETYPTHPNVVAQSIEFHKRVGEYERALEVAQIAFAAEPNEGSGYRLVMAELLRTLGRPDEAEVLLVEAADLTDNPVAQSAALLALTEHHQKLGNVTAAVDSLERALAIAQSSIGPQPDLLFSLADLLIQTGDDERALLLAAQMSVAAHRSLVRARVAHDRKQYMQALKLYADTTRLWPENAFAPYHEARAALAAGLFDRAFKSYLLSVRVDDTATDARLQAARMLRAEGRLTPALEMLGSSRVGQSPDSQLLVIEIGAQQRGPAAGINAANRMSRTRPEYFGEAIAAAARGASHRDDPRAPWMVVGPMLQHEFPPVNQFPVLRAAALYAPGEEELTRVRPLVEKAVAAHPERADVHEIEGILLERSELASEAETSYRAALALEPTRVSALLRLARVISASDPQGAHSSLSEALQAQATSIHSLDDALFLDAISALPASPELTALLESAVEVAPVSGAIAYRLALALEADGAEKDRLARVAARAVRFQAGDEAKAFRDRVIGQS